LIAHPNLKDTNVGFDGASLTNLRIPVLRADKLYVSRNLAGLLDNAARLLQQAMDMQSASDLVVLELPAGGYYLVPGAGSNLVSLQMEHGARAGWQVRDSGASVTVTALSGDESCSLERRRTLALNGAILRDRPAYRLA
jgi:hypothetical protein